MADLVIPEQVYNEIIRPLEAKKDQLERSRDGWMALCYVLAFKPDYPHDSINHSAHEYVRGLVHTASIDSFWSLLKRGIMGSFHHVSKEYLPMYVNEFAWRHNQRKNPDAFNDLVTTCGK